MRPLRLLNVTVDSDIYINKSEPRLFTQVVQWTYASRPRYVEPPGSRSAASVAIKQIIRRPNKSGDIHPSLFY